MQLQEVRDKKTAREFIATNVELYKNDPNYIRPLDKDINDVFDPAKNKAFRSGEAIRWILQDDKGKNIGRIAAFANNKYRNKGDEFPVGGIGFFDCTNDQRAANMLFDVAKHWLMQRGFQAMDGPINFGERDRWWGVLVEGFQPPVYCLNYNYPYYKELFENYGFRTFYHQICYGLDPIKKVSDKIIARHALVAADPNYSAKYIDKKQLKKFAADFTIAYNKAWAGHGGLKKLRNEQVLTMFRKMKPVMDEKIVWFAYYKDEPIAIFVNLPDLNQWIKYLNGKFDLFHKLKFLWVKLTKLNKSFVGLVFGIVPEFQGKGVDAYIIYEAALVVQPLNKYRSYEMQWIGAFNPKMLNVVENFGETFQSRKLTTYRYIFDRTVAFTPHPLV